MPWPGGGRVATLLSLWVLIIGFVGQLDAEIFGSVVFTPLGIVTALAVAEVRALRRGPPIAAGTTGSSDPAQRDQNVFHFTSGAIV